MDIFYITSFKAAIKNALNGLFIEQMHSEAEDENEGIEQITANTILVKDGEQREMEQVKWI